MDRAIYNKLIGPDHCKVSGKSFSHHVTILLLVNWCSLLAFTSLLQPRSSEVEQKEQKWSMQGRELIFAVLQFDLHIMEILQECWVSAVLLVAADVCRKLLRISVSLLRGVACLTMALVCKWHIYVAALERKLTHSWQTLSWRYWQLSEVADQKGLFELVSSASVVFKLLRSAQHMVTYNITVSISPQAVISSK